MTGKIEGKYFQLKITGVAPPGMTDEQIVSTAVTSISVMASLMPFVRDVKTDVLDDEPADVKKRRMLIQ